MNAPAEAQARKAERANTTTAAEWIANQGLSLFEYFRGLTLLFLDFCVGLVMLKGNQRRYTKTLIINQIIFSGVDAIFVCSLISMMVGGVVMVQLLAFSPGFQTDAILMKIMVGLVAKEIAPIFSALILVGRSGSAITVELGEMKIRRQDEALEVMGINMTQYFHIPRIVGLGVSGAILNGYFVMMTLFSWLLISNFQKNVRVADMVNLLAGSLSMADFGVGALKGVMLGITIAVVCLYHGGEVERSATEIPQRTSRAIVDSFLYCFVINAAISFAWYALS